MKLRLNYIYALISMTLVLFLAGAFGSIVIQSQQLVRLFKERVMIIVEINKGFVEEEIQDLQTYITEKNYVKPASVSYTSKDEAAKMMQQDFGSDVSLEEFNLVNPLYDIITFHVKAEFMTQRGLEKIAKTLKEDDRVSDVSYEGNLASTISSYWNRMGWIGLSASLILGLVAIFLIVYSIRQALYTDRFLIKNMHLVGATPRFISRPYIRMGILGGVISSVLAGMGLFVLRWWLIAQLPSLGSLFTWASLGLVCGILFVFGILVTTSSTWLSVRNYLKSDVNQLYN